MTDRDTGTEHGSACELSDIVSCLVHAPCDKASYLGVAFSRNKYHHSPVHHHYHHEPWIGKRWRDGSGAALILNSYFIRVQEVQDKSIWFKSTMSL